MTAEREWKTVAVDRTVAESIATDGKTLEGDA
jgi:hypothetical protein